MVSIQRDGQSAKANSVDPDQTAPEEQSDQGLHCANSMTRWKSLLR